MKSLLELIEEQGIELKPIGKDIYRGYCVLHDDKVGGKPQFTYYAATESFYCYRCNLGGDNIRFFSELEHISYADAKKKLLGTEQEQLEELKNNLEDLDVEMAQSYNLQLNFALRPKFRDLFYKYPERSQDILMAMKVLDGELKGEINFNKMLELSKRFQKFQEQIVAESK